MACAQKPQAVPTSAETNPYAGGTAHPWSDRLDAPGTDPYAHGRDFRWVGPHSSGPLGKLAATPNFLSDLTWTSATNAWGPVERDRSNGEQAAGDGRPLTIGSQLYQKGLGVHANSELRFTLGGTCTTFSAFVGVDAEVGARGSVVFQLWDGGNKLYDSGTLRGGDAAREVNVSVSGVQTLRMVVNNGGDSIDYDHADWANAAVECASPAPPGGTTPLGAFAWQSASNGWGPVERNSSNGEQGAGDGNPLTIGGVTYAQGLGVHAGSQLSFALVGKCSSFTAAVGIDAEVERRGSVSFQLWNGVAGEAGSALLYDSGVVRGGEGARTVNVALAGVQTLQLVVTNGGDNIDYDHADWADAKVTCSSGPAPTLTTIDYQKIADQPYGVSEAQAVAVNAQLYVFGGFDILRGATPTDRAYRYDPAENRWTALATMPDRGVTHAGITSDGAFIYYAGGYIADSSGDGQVFGTRAVYRYDVAKNTYARLPDLPTECAAGQLQVLNGTLHYFGGLNLSRTQDMTTHYVLSLNNATGWTLAAPMPEPRNHFGSVILNGRIYAIGGQTGTDEGLVTHSDVFAYDPGQDTWTVLKGLPFGRSHISNSTFVIAGRIVVAGGETAHTVPTADVSAYDPASNTWTPLTALPEVRSSAGAAAIDSQRFLFTGGAGLGDPQSSGWMGTIE